MKEYVVKIKTLADFMPGSGESVPGLVDSDSRFDECGLPYMSAKAFKGHVREQMENLVRWQSLNINPDTLLGASDINSEKKPGKLKFTDVCVSEPVRTVIYEKTENGQICREDVIDAITSIYAFTKIDENGVAEDHTLRRVRMVNSGIELYTSIFAEDLTPEEEKLLEDTIKAIQHIGSYKSKGKGVVSCEKTEVRDVISVPEDALNSGTESKPGKYVTFKIYAQEPVKMGGHGNQSNTTALDYIAGSSIRGAVIDKYIKKILGGDGERIDKDRELSDKLLKDTYFFDAYLCLDENPLMPTPGIFFADKHKIREQKRNEESGNNTPLSVNNRTHEKPVEGEQKVGGGSYCRLGKDSVGIATVRKCGNLHVAVTKEEMYRYEAVDKGQVFYGVIKCKDERAAEEIAGIISGETVYLGGSRGSGYGRCQVKECKTTDYDNVMAGYGVSEGLRDNKQGELVIYALSNLILTDKNGKPTAFAECSFLEEKLGIRNVKLVKHFVSSVISSGYNHKWRTGNQQKNAVKAGSYMRYEYDGEIDENKLSELEEDGLGQRKQEGFGRILINPFFGQGSINKLEKTKRKMNINIQMTDTEKALLLVIQTGINLAKEQREAEKLAQVFSDKYLQSHDKKLSKTQVSRIYDLLSKRTTGRNDVTAFLDHINDNIKREYETSYIYLPDYGKINFYEPLTGLASSENKWNTSDHEETELVPLDKIEEREAFFAFNKKLFSEILYGIMRKGGVRYETKCF